MTGGHLERLCREDEMKQGTARRFEIGDHRICLIRIGDDFYAIGDRCSHADFSLSEGELYPAEREIECWKHGSTFSIVDGKPQSLPATRPVPVYDIHREGGDVMVMIR
ncbi:MAG: non-heme iron oxygenase ferredoxin subunit [Actinomycetota bacterium]|nr:non-heme iron oxygenase ferredoxin subunit [Actinomycetota bacterium]